MGAYLMQKSQSLDDPIVEIEQLPALGYSALGLAEQSDGLDGYA